jgi:hypothetical protein
MSLDLLNVDLIIDKNLTLKFCFAQNPLTPLSSQIFMYG